MTQKTQICEVFDDDFPFHMFSFKSFQDIAAINDIADTPLFGMIFNVYFVSLKIKMVITFNFFGADIIGVIVDSSNIINQHNAKLIELKIEDEKYIY